METERAKRLASFVSWVEANIKGDEKGEAQVFLDRFFQAFGHAGLREAGATLEERIKKSDGKGTAFHIRLMRPSYTPPQLQLPGIRDGGQGRSARARTARGNAIEARPWPARAPLNRLELTPVGADEESRYKKIIGRHTRHVEGLFVELFLQAHPVPPERDRAGSRRHRRSRCTAISWAASSTATTRSTVFCRCTFSAAIICCVRRLRPSDIDGSGGALEATAATSSNGSARYWPKVKIVVRGDSGFCREPMMRLVRRERRGLRVRSGEEPRLLRLIAGRSWNRLGGSSRQPSHRPRGSSRISRYKTLESWSRERRVVGKAEHLEKGANPRFVVTSFGLEAHPTPRSSTRMSTVAVARWKTGIKEQQRSLFADRTSASTMRANQIAAVVLLVDGLHLAGDIAAVGSDGARSMAEAQCDTIRLEDC